MPASIWGFSQQGGQQGVRHSDQYEARTGSDCRHCKCRKCQRDLFWAVRVHSMLSDQKLATWTRAQECEQKLWDAQRPQSTVTHQKRRRRSRWP